MIVATLPLGVTEAFSFAGVPAGTLSVHGARAVNASGISAPSNPVTLTFPGSPSCAAPPLPPSNVTATTSGNFASLTWQPPPGGATATSYVVNVTGSFTGQLPTASLGIAGTVAPGTYVVTVQAVNPCGASAAYRAGDVHGWIGHAMRQTLIVPGQLATASDQVGTRRSPSAANGGPA